MNQRSSLRPSERSSPRRQSSITNELDGHSNRIKQLLRADLIMLEEENSILKTKCKKVGELQEKVEIILKQNSQLLAENERLSKLLFQKKQEYEMIKDKFEVLSSQKMEYATEYEFERKKLLNQIEQLENQLKEIEHYKSSQVNELKSQYQIDLQTYKRQSTASQEIYEQQIRKLREQLDKKQYELNDSLNRLKRFSSEAEYDILRLKEEKQKLRSQLVYLENDKKKQLDSIRAKLQTNYLEQIQSIKKNHLTSLENFEQENIKIKDLLQSKTIEIEQLTSKLNKQKITYQESISLTKRQNEMFRSKMVEYERFSESEKDALKAKLNKVHESEIEEMKTNHQKYIECIQTEIIKLEGALNKKNAEIQQLIKEKTTVRQMFDSEGNRLKEELDTLQSKLKQSEAKLLEITNSYEEKVKQKNKHIDYLDKLNQDQLENQQKEVTALKKIIEHQAKQFQSEQVKNKQRDLLNEETISELKTENNNLKDTLSRQRVEKQKKMEDLTYQFENTISGLKARVDTLTSKNNMMERELNSLRETLSMKEKQIKLLNERVKVCEEREKKLERQNDDLKNKLIKKDQKTNEMLAEQKKRLQQIFAFTIDNLKMDHESAIKLQSSKQADLLEKLKKKELELDELLKAYKKMREGMQALTEQEANRKQMTLKYPGATADLIATKNLFDVFLKSRVLDVCGDVRNKQNK